MLKTEKIKFNDSFFDDVVERLSSPKKKPTPEDVRCFRQDVENMEKFLKSIGMKDYTFGCYNKICQVIFWDNKYGKIYTAYTGHPNCELKNASDATISLCIENGSFRHFAEELCCDMVIEYTPEQQSIISEVKSHKSITNVRALLDVDGLLCLTFMIGSNFCTIKESKDKSFYSFCCGLKTIKFTADTAKVFIHIVSVFCDASMYYLNSQPKLFLDPDKYQKINITY